MTNSGESTPLWDVGQSRRLWVVRAGRQATAAARFLSDSKVAIGFDLDESAAGRTADELTARLNKLVPDQAPVSVGLAVGALDRLANKFRVGDYVLTPERGGSLLAGEVVGDYEFRSPPKIEDFCHERPVRWFARIERSALPEDVRRSLGSILTLFLPAFQDELIALLESRSDGELPATLQVTGSATHGESTALQAIPIDPVEPPKSVGGRFGADKQDLFYLLDGIKNRDLALPDFQRSFVWDAGATRELIVSIIRGFPAGNLLFLRGGSDVFIPRAVEGAPDLDEHRPTLLVLDGQQRLSSLYQALSGVGAHRFYVDVAALMRGEDVDAAIKAFTLRQARLWDTRVAQARHLMFPLALARDFADWRDEVLEKRDDLDEDERRRLGSYLNQVDKSIANPIRMYQFPVTTLSEETPTEAVCTIFETLNRTGVKLSVFELICARAFAEGERLRERWKDATSNHQILDDFVIDPYYLLQAIALRVGKKPQRGVVAGLDVATIVQEWDAAVLGMVKGLKMLREECGVLTLRLLPYAPMLPTLAASWGLVDGATGPAQGARRRKLQQWFWCASFAGDYDNAPNSRAEADMPLLKKWLEDGEAHPVVANFTFEPSTWSSVTPRQRGLYRSTMALLMRHHPLDFHLTQPLTKATIDAGAVDDHHIFPRKYLEELGLAGRPDSILNHTLIDKVTNIRIGKKAPSVYLSEMEVELKGTLDQVLTSHGLPSAKDGPLWRDDYDGFLEWRLGHLTSELESVSQGGS